MKFIEIQTVRFATKLTKKRRYTNNTVIQKEPQMNKLEED